jgi:hypothetical protein
MKFTTTVRARLLMCCAVRCSATYTAHAAPVLYTFTATTEASLGSPSHLEQFQLEAPDFLPLVLNGGFCHICVVIQRSYPVPPAQTLRSRLCISFEPTPAILSSSETQTVSFARAFFRRTRYLTQEATIPHQGSTWPSANSSLQKRLSRPP